MFHPLQLFIGLRYTRAKRRNHFISFISLVSMLGIAVGVMALIAVMWVMNGFQSDTAERILGMVAHATIEGVDEGIARLAGHSDEGRASPHVLGAAPYIEAQALLRGRRISARDRARRRAGAGAEGVQRRRRRCSRAARAISKSGSSA